jgi:predicted aspartyl protease
MAKAFSRISALVLSLVLTLGSSASFAQESMGKAVQLFTAGKYAEACKLFSAYTAANPNNADAYYYLALCYQKLNNVPAALKYYDYVIKSFPGTQAAAYSLSGSSALRNPNAKTGQQTSAASGSAGASTGLEGPDEDRVPLTRGPGGHLMVMARINGRPLEMIFDTGASSTVLSMDAWKNLGNPAPSGPPTGQSMGVGGLANNWETNATIELGKFKRTMPIHITDGMKINGLVGQTFFNQLQYNLSGNNYIHIMRPNAKSASRSIPFNTVDIPFRRVGNELYIEAKVNGVPMTAIFDTGAAHCLFDLRQLASSGISIPRDAGVGMVSGVGGGRLAYSFRVDSLALGDVVKRNFEITASDTGVSLIGQSFFSDRQYVIDNEKGVIHFLR